MEGVQLQQIRRMWEDLQSQIYAVVREDLPDDPATRAGMINYQSFYQHP
jgi:hypothetical protein